MFEKTMDQAMFIVGLGYGSGLGFGFISSLLPHHALPGGHASKAGIGVIRSLFESQ